MRRPLLLLAVALVAGLVVASGIGPFGGPPSVRATEDAGGATVLNPFQNGSLANTVTHVHVGERSDDPVAVAVLNDGATRSVPTTIRHEPSNETVSDRRIRLPQSASAVVLFHTPAEYRVTIRTEKGPSALVIDRTAFDCNDRTLGLVVEQDGDTTERGISTSMDCGGV